MINGGVQFKHWRTRFERQSGWYRVRRRFRRAMRSYCRWYAKPWRGINPFLSWQQPVLMAVKLARGEKINQSSHVTTAKKTLMQYCFTPEFLCLKQSRFTVIADVTTLVTLFYNLLSSSFLWRSIERHFCFFSICFFLFLIIRDAKKEIWKRGAYMKHLIGHMRGIVKSFSPVVVALNGVSIQLGAGEATCPYAARTGSWVNLRLMKSAQWCLDIWFLMKAKFTFEGNLVKASSIRDTEALGIVHYPSRIGARLKKCRVLENYFPRQWNLVLSQAQCEEMHRRTFGSVGTVNWMCCQNTPHPRPWCGPNAISRNWPKAW